MDQEGDPSIIPFTRSDPLVFLTVTKKTRSNTLGNRISISGLCAGGQGGRLTTRVTDELVAGDGIKTSGAKEEKED